MREYSRKDVMKKRFRLLLSLLLAFTLVTGSLPIGAKADEDKIYYSGYLYDQGRLTVTDSKGTELPSYENVITPGEKLTVSVELYKGYDFKDDASANIEYYSSAEDKWVSSSVALNKKGQATFNAPEQSFSIGITGIEAYFNVTVNADKNVKSVTAGKETLGKKAAKVFSHGTFSGMSYVLISVDLAKGYEIASATISNGNGYSNAICSDGSISFCLDRKYVYDDDYNVIDIDVDTTITIKTQKSAKAAPDLSKAKTATATYKANKKGDGGVVTLTYGKKTVIKHAYTPYSWGGGYFDGGTKYNASAAEKVEVIDLSKCKKLDSDSIYSLLYWLNYEYKCGKYPNLKGIALPAGCTIEVRLLDSGYMEYYPLVIYNK